MQQQQETPRTADTPPAPEEASPGDVNAADLLEDAALLAALRQASPPARVRSQGDLASAEAPQLIRGDLAAITARSRGCFCKNSRRVSRPEALPRERMSRPML